MADVLLVYASTHGHVAKIADRLAAAMRDAGSEVEVVEAAAAGDADPGDHGTAVVIASLHKAKHQPEAIDWASRHREALNSMPGVFLSVSLTAAEDSDESRERTRGCVDEFLEETGWKPDRAEALAGALQYREYDPFTRALVRLLMKQGGHPTDTSRDYDYTDWDGVDRLGAELAAMPAGTGGR
jgi:menaquinone-dependent protoporphyrinogen oxidase